MQFKSSFPKLNDLIRAGMTTEFAVAVALGIEEKRLGSLLNGSELPTEDCERSCQGLLWLCERAGRGAAALTLRTRLADGLIDPVAVNGRSTE